MEVGKIEEFQFAFELALDLVTRIGIKDRPTPVHGNNQRAPRFDDEAGDMRPDPEISVLHQVQGTTTWASSIDCSVLTTENFSIVSKTLPLRRKPAVSIRVYFSRHVRNRHKSRRAVPGLVKRDHRSSPSSAVIIVLLPTFGRQRLRREEHRPRFRLRSAPDMAQARLQPGSARLRRELLKSRQDRPAPTRGSPRPRHDSPSIVWRQRPAAPLCRSLLAISLSSAVIPVLPSTTKMIASASAIACSAWRAILHDSVPGQRFEAARYRRPGTACYPPFRGRSGDHASEPGISATKASRVLVKRLKSVDLPTFGRPTMTMVGFIRPRWRKVRLRWFWTSTPFPSFAAAQQLHFRPLSSRAMNDPSSRLRKCTIPSASATAT